MYIRLECQNAAQTVKVHEMQHNQPLTLYRLYSLLVPMQMLFSHQARLLGVSLRMTSVGGRGLESYTLKKTKPLGAATLGAGGQVSLQTRFYLTK